MSVWNNGYIWKRHVVWQIRIYRLTHWEPEKNELYETTENVPRRRKKSKKYSTISSRVFFNHSAISVFCIISWIFNGHFLLVSLSTNLSDPPFSFFYESSIRYHLLVLCVTFLSFCKFILPNKIKHNSPHTKSLYFAVNWRFSHKVPTFFCIYF